MPSGKQLRVTGISHDRIQKYKTGQDIRVVVENQTPLKCGFLTFLPVIQALWCDRKPTGGDNCVARRQTAESAYFSGEQLLLFAFAGRSDPPGVHLGLTC